MKLSPLDVEQQQFPLTLRGYQPIEVERYLTFVARALTERDESIRALKDRLVKKDDDLKGLQAREEEVRGAMLLTQRAIEDLKSQAVQEAQAVVEAAEERASSLMRDARNNVAGLEESIQSLRAQRDALAEDLSATLHKHAQALAVVLGNESRASSSKARTPTVQSRHEDELEPLTADDALAALEAAAPEIEAERQSDQMAWTSLENSTN